MQIAGSSVKVISLKGEFDLSRRRQLWNTLNKGLGFDVVLIDLEHVTYMDSTGLTCLIRLRNRVATYEGVVAFVATPPHIRRLFEMWGFHRVFPMYDSLPEAQALFDGSLYPVD
jgi:anti-sigma B factor antagonist